MPVSPRKDEWLDLATFVFMRDLEDPCENGGGSLPFWNTDGNLEGALSYLQFPIMKSFFSPLLSNR